MINELLSNPIVLWKSIASLVVFLALTYKIYRWFEKGGSYNLKYPIAAKMDSLARSGDLEGKNVEAAIQSVDLSGSMQVQVQTFEENIKRQNIRKG